MTYFGNWQKLALLIICIWGVVVCIAWLIKRAADRRLEEEAEAALKAKQHEMEIERRADELYEQFLREVSQ